MEVGVQMYKNKVVVVTGDGHGIGLATRKAFEAAGARVYGIDLNPGSFYQGDIGQPAVLQKFVESILKNESKIDVLVNNALPLSVGIHNGSLSEFNDALQVGVVAPFYLTQLLLNHFNPGSSIINLSSTRAFQSQAETESYAAAKGAITALTHSLAISLSKEQIRVNAIAPGWIDTYQHSFSGSDVSQHPSKKVGVPEDIAELILFLASNKASFINGQTITVDGGMSKLMIYHNDQGWSYHSEE